MMGGGSDDLLNEMSSKWWSGGSDDRFNEMSRKWWAVVVTIVLMKCPVNDGRWYRFNEMSSKWRAVVVTIAFNEMSS